LAAARLARPLRDKRVEEVWRTVKRRDRDRESLEPE
jgi:hypothetical protein